MAKHTPAGSPSDEHGTRRKKGRGRQSLTHERLRRLAKKHHPPEEFYRGDIERPW